MGGTMRNNDALQLAEYLAVDGDPIVIKHYIEKLGGPEEALKAIKEVLTIAQWTKFSAFVPAFKEKWNE